MIKPINIIEPLNTANQLEYKCEKCGDFGTFTLTANIDVDNEGKPLETLKDYECQKCGANL
jgi:hypothetical protein